MNFDVVITTCNRPEEVTRLSQEIFLCEPAPGKLIIVDSSDNVTSRFKDNVDVIHVKSSHKNQPYQRLLGAKVSLAEVIVFLDDDLSVLRKDIFKFLLEPFQGKDIVGTSVAFEHHNSTLQKVEEPLLDGESILIKVIWKITGASSPEKGKMGRLGLTGLKPLTSSNVQSFNGASMAYIRNRIEKIIPDDLLSLYERKLGKGEDKVISMLAQQYGKLMYLPEVCLLHPPNESSYFQDIRTFFAKVTYSRLYLSWVYAKVFNKLYAIEVLIYYWFTIWRILIALFSWLARPSKGRKEKLLGILDGFWLSLRLPQKAARLTPGLDWQAEIAKDLTASNVMI